MNRNVLKYLKIILLLVALDIFVKIVIDNFFMDNRLYICDNIGFVPKLNTQELSSFNLVFNLGVDIKILVILNVAFLLLLSGGLYFEMRKANIQKYVEWTLVIALAASICSLIDKVCWGGSLDYILFFSYIVDLKDIYIGIAFIIAFVGALNESCEKKELIKHYIGSK